VRRQRKTRQSNRVAASTADRHSEWLRLSSFLFAVFVVKLIVAMQLDQHPLLTADSGLDTAAHLGLARRVLGGDVLLGPGLYYMSPLYTYFLAVVLFVHDSLAFVRSVQAVLGTVAVACVVLMARQWFGARAGWIAGVIAALTGEFTFYEILILQSSLDTVLTAGALLLLTYALMRGDRAALYGFGSGLVFGLSLLNRPNVGLAVAAIIVVLLRLRRWRLAAAVSAGALCLLAPVVARNALVSREFALLSSQGGLNFYIGNHSSATGQYVSVPDVRSNIEGQSEDTRRVASQALGRMVGNGEASGYFSGMAFRWIRSEPAAAARLFVKKMLLVFNWRHQWLDYSYPYYAHDVDSLLSFLVIGPWLILPLGLAGLFVVRPKASIGSFVAWVAFVPIYAAAVALFFVAERYRLPLLIALCVPAGALIDRLLELRRSAPVGLALPAAITAACAIAYWPFHLESGRFEERLRLSKVLMNRGDFEGAVRELEAAHDLKPDDLVTEFNLGTALVSDGRAREGIDHLDHAVNRGVDVPGARYALAGAILATRDRPRAAALIQTFTPTPNDDADSCYHVALLAISAGEFGTAKRFLLRALQLRPGWYDAERALAGIQSK
jgi:4-amino-4-deoxy-L-arabinose transferase-like glycosyltransferase